MLLLEHTDTGELIRNVKMTSSSVQKVATPYTILFLISFPNFNLKFGLGIPNVKSQPICLTY